MLSLITVRPTVNHAPPTINGRTGITESPLCIEPNFCAPLGTDFLDFTMIYDDNVICENYLKNTSNSVKEKISKYGIYITVSM